MEIIATTKIINRDGIKAIKNGQKLNKYSDIPSLKKPSWLKVKAEFNPNFHKVKEQVHSKQLYTVCEEAHCPNISECWSAGTATFMLMGSVCTRACKFCSVDTGNPNGWLDKDEPINIFNEAINNIKPTVEVRSRRIGGATYQVPVEVKSKRSQALALRWLIDASRKRKDKKMSDKIFNEIYDAYQNRGSAIKKKEDTHKMAESNKAFAHFRW